jgi:hypothetical protein
VIAAAPAVVPAVLPVAVVHPEAPIEQPEALIVQPMAPFVPPMAPVVQPVVPFVQPAPSVAQEVTATEMAAALQESGALSQVLAALTNNTRPPRQSSWFNDTSEGVRMSPLDRHLETCLNMLAAGNYVEPVSLDSISIDYLKFKAPFAPPRLEASASGSMVVRANTRVPDTSTVFDASRVFSGYSKLIELASTDVLKRFSAFQVGQMLGVSNLVQSISYATEASKAIFFKHFLLQTAGVTDLVKAFNESSMLLMKFLVMQALPPPPRMPFRDAVPAPSRRGTKRALVGPSLASSSRGGSAVMSASSARDSRMRSSSDKPCKSRCDTAFTCTYPDCVFSHACVSCGQNHPASVCTSWDAAKGAAAMALIGTRRRG